MEDRAIKPCPFAMLCISRCCVKIESTSTPKILFNRYA